MKFKKDRQTKDASQADLGEAVVAGTNRDGGSAASPGAGADATGGADAGTADKSAETADQNAEAGKSPQAGKSDSSRGYGIPTSTSGEEEAGFRGSGDTEKMTGTATTDSKGLPKIVTKVEYEDYQPRQVRLVVSRIEPWTVMKVTFLLAVCFGIAVIFASILVWLLLNSMHVFSSVESFINDIDPSGAVAALIDYVRLPRVIAMSTILAVANVILLTAFMTVGALLYNLAAALVGGVKLALTDD